MSDNDDITFVVVVIIMIIIITTTTTAYNSACGNNQDFVCRLCDEKGSYSPGKVDSVINKKISGWLFP